MKEEPKIHIVDHQITDVLVRIRSMSPVSLDKIKRLVEQAYEIVECENIGEKYATMELASLDM